MATSSGDAESIVLRSLEGEKWEFKLFRRNVADQRSSSVIPSESIVFQGGSGGCCSGSSSDGEGK